MRMLARLFAVTALASGAFVAAHDANAVVITVSGAVGGAPVGATNYVTFNSLALGNAGGTDGGITVSFTGTAQTVINRLSGKYAAPLLSGGNGTLFGNANGVDTTRYLSTGIGSVTLLLPGPTQYLGLLWGSIDGYNSLEFYSGATLLDTITGSEVTSSPNGNQGVNGTLYVNFNSDTPFNRVVARSSSYAFEFDNVAYLSGSGPQGAGDPVSAPATLALFGAALTGLGLARLRPA